MIRVYDDLVPPDLFDRVNAALSGLVFRYGWKSSISKNWPGHWNATIAPGDHNNTEDVSHYLEGYQGPWAAFRDYWALLRETIYKGREAALLRYYSNVSTYGTDGYPHTDSLRSDEESVVLYAVKDWQPEWAGATAIWDPAGRDVERAVMPKPGRIVVFTGSRLHAAWAPSRICPVERRVLVVKVRP